MTVILHDKIHLRDRAAVFAFRCLMPLQKESPLGPEARAGYDKMIARTTGASGISYEADTVGGVSGWWCLPVDPIGTGIILYLHGGGYVLGSARAYRHFVGQIAARARLPAFVADYGLAPERSFPAAVNDAMAAYRGLADLGHTRIVLTGDSAGAGLALVLLAKASRDASLPRPAGAMVLSPLTDFALTGSSIESLAKVDPVLKRNVLAEIAAMYLGDCDPRAPDASPLYGDLSNLPPTLIHVGDFEILLDDSLRYADRMDAAGGNVVLHVWRGMPHVFSIFVGLLKSSTEALDIAGAFIRQLPYDEPVPS
ncbi:alpha/beta hydrolase [Beijerinckia sp. L45]|uniref:alpha/beta hydrolase n=1 Tax=Beijerinckia sp. L45 TaxID=1641855 RepID=UPI00131BDDC4|nr:alpha/beta hydrolase [Beijerinckia sp. L45]